MILINIFQKKIYGDAQNLRGVLRGGPAHRHALLARGRVGDAGVDHHRPGRLHFPHDP